MPQRLSDFVQLAIFFRNHAGHAVVSRHFSGLRAETEKSRLSAFCLFQFVYFASDSRENYLIDRLCKPQKCLFAGFRAFEHACVLQYLREHNANFLLQDVHGVLFGKGISRFQLVCPIGMRCRVFVRGLIRPGDQCLCHSGKLGFEPRRKNRQTHDFD